jgi:putative MATE family efflux protein
MAFGANDGRAAADIGVQALLIGIVSGVVVALLGVLSAPSIVALLGGRTDIGDLAIPYLRIRVLSAPFVLLALVGHGWLRGAQDTRTPMVIAVSGAALNTVLDYVLIYPAGLGVAGAAWATVISQALVALWFLAVLRPRLIEARWSFRSPVARSLLTVGADLVLRTGSLLAALTIATAVAARMGKVELGAWQITSQIFLLLSLSMDSLAIAAQALIAKHLGAREPGAARRVGNRLLELGLGIGVVIGVVLILVRVPLADVFTADPDVRREAARLIALFGLVQPIGGLVFTLDGILIGALVTRFLAVAMLACSVIFIAVSGIAYEFDWGVAGLFGGAAAWLLARLLSTGAYYLSPRWTSRH